MVGVYQHCGEAHLHRYLTEFGFRYNSRSGPGITDKQRVDAIMEGSKASVSHIDGPTKPKTPEQIVRCLLSNRRQKS